TITRQGAPTRRLASSQVHRSRRRRFLYLPRTCCSSSLRATQGMACSLRLLLRYGFLTTKPAVGWTTTHIWDCSRATLSLTCFARVHRTYFFPVSAATTPDAPRSQRSAIRRPLAQRR